MLIGTVQQIWRYPVKSMAGEKLSESAPLARSAYPATAVGPFE